MRSATIAPYLLCTPSKSNHWTYKFRTLLFLKAYQWSCEPNDTRLLKWSITFSSGFHDMLHVKFYEFSGVKWDMIETLEIWAKFENSSSKDWEFVLMTSK